MSPFTRDAGTRDSGTRDSGTEENDTEDTVEVDLSALHDDRGGDKGDEKTVRLARKRFARRQWTRRWLAWRKVVVVVLVVGLLLGATWLVFFSSVLAVDGVQVTGTRSLSPSVVRSAADVPMGGPLATVDLGGVTARVKRLPAVRTVDVSRSWPDKVRIDVTERRAVAVVEPQSGGLPHAVDSDGVQFRALTHAPRGLPVIRVKTAVGPDALTEAARVAGALPAGLARKVAFVEVRTVDTIALVLHNGRMVRWGSADGSADKARVLAVLLRQKASFYDVSVPGQPVIRR